MTKRRIRRLRDGTYEPVVEGDKGDAGGRTVHVLVHFQVPEDIRRQFNLAFRRADRDSVIAELMRQAILDVRLGGKSR